jgi:hypothetical protein
MTATSLYSLLNSAQADSTEVNDFLSTPCYGVTLATLRQRLRNQLSGYAPGTLISNDASNDVERQFINDGVSQLWPHDWQAVNYAIKTTGTRDSRYYLPDDCESVLTTQLATMDINNNSVQFSGLPQGDSWIFDKSFIDAVSPTLIDGTSWVDQPKKAIWIKPPLSWPWVIVRYARKWPQLLDDQACIDPSPNRVQAIIWYACAQYFLSQLQVNTESIRYRNYQQMATNFLQLFQQQLIRDSKPLYFL